MYIGGDIVPALVQQLQAKHASPTRQFAVIDLVTDTIPQVCPVLSWPRCMRSHAQYGTGYIGHRTASRQAMSGPPGEVL
jgi:hypothetical protein